MRPAVIDLDVARGPEIGGKAAPLAELLRAGFDVPPGFVVPRSVFRDAVAGLGIAGPTQEVREKLLATALPPSVDGAIARALDRLTGRSASGCVAVPLVVVIGGHRPEFGGGAAPQRARRAGSRRGARRDPGVLGVDMERAGRRLPCARGPR